MAEGPCSHEVFGWNLICGELDFIIISVVEVAELTSTEVKPIQFFVNHAECTIMEASVFFLRELFDERKKILVVFVSP